MCLILSSSDFIGFQPHIICADVDSIHIGMHIANVLGLECITPTLRRFADGELNIAESGNGIPDLLDEAKWELDFIAAMVSLASYRTLNTTFAGCELDSFCREPSEGTEGNTTPKGRPTSSPDQEPHISTVLDESIDPPI